MTLKQTCLLTLLAIILLHIRMGKAVSFGRLHWIIWAPAAVIVTTSTTAASVLSVSGVPTFFYALVAQASTVAALTTVLLLCLVATLKAIKRNVAGFNEPTRHWPPAQDLADKPRHSFTTEDIDVLKDGSSWITSNASSRRGSMSQWSFSTHRTSFHGSIRANQFIASNPSIKPKSSFWFNGAGHHEPDDVPPVPPLPSQYKYSREGSTPSPVLTQDPDPFRKDAQEYQYAVARMRMGSQSSWLTSPSVSEATVSVWSFPTDRDRVESPMSMSHVHLLSSSPSPGCSHPTTAAMANAQVLGGYGYSQNEETAEAGATKTSYAANEIDVSMWCTLTWLATIWIPLVCNLTSLDIPV